MNGKLVSFGVIGMISGVLVMIRNDIVGYIIGGTFVTIGLGLMLYGLYND